MADIFNMAVRFYAVLLFAAVCVHGSSHYMEDYNKTSGHYQDKMEVGQDGSDTSGFIYASRTSYKPYMDCMMRVEVVAGHQVYLTFNDFKLRCTDGVLKIMGEVDTISCCYPAYDCQYKSFYGSGNWLDLKLLTNNTTDGNFEISYQEFYTVPAGTYALIVCIVILSAILLVTIVYFALVAYKKHRTKTRSTRPETSSATSPSLSSSRDPEFPAEPSVVYTPPPYSYVNSSMYPAAQDFDGAFPSPPLYDEVAGKPDKAPEYTVD